MSGFRGGPNINFNHKRKFWKNSMDKPFFILIWRLAKCNFLLKDKNKNLFLSFLGLPNMASQFLKAKVENFAIIFSDFGFCYNPSPTGCHYGSCWDFTGVELGFPIGERVGTHPPAFGAVKDRHPWGPSCSSRASLPAPKRAAKQNTKPFFFFFHLDHSSLRSLNWCWTKKKKAKKDNKHVWFANHQGFLCPNLIHNFRNFGWPKLLTLRIFGSNPPHKILKSSLVRIYALLSNLIPLCTDSLICIKMAEITTYWFSLLKKFLFHEHYWFPRSEESSPGTKRNLMSKL